MSLISEKKELYKRILKPLFDDIGSGFSLKRLRGTDHIKGDEAKTFKQEYLSVDGATLDKYINTRINQEVMKSNGQKQLSNNQKQLPSKPIKPIKNLPSVVPDSKLISSPMFPASEVSSNIKESVQNEVITLLRQIRDNTTPMSFKEKVLAKKENDDDDKNLRELIAALKESQDLANSNNSSGGGSGGSCSNNSDNGFLPDFDRNDKDKKPGKNPKGGGKWNKAKSLGKSGLDLLGTPKGMGIATTAVVGATEAYDYASGNKEPDVVNISKTVGRMIGAGLGASGGAMLGTAVAPGIGTYGGGMAGGAAGGEFGDWLGGKIGRLLQGGGSDKVSSRDSEKEFQGSSDDVKKAITEAASKTGVSEDMMKKMASIESGFKPNAKASTSSAGGLYQFIDKTWAYMLKKHGKKHGLSKDTSRFDPKANALMGAEYMKDNIAELSKVKRVDEINNTDVYSAHFLGSTEAGKFIKATQENPNLIAAELLPKPANSNKAIFYKKDGTPRTVGEVYALLTKKVEGTNTPQILAKASTPKSVPAKKVASKKSNTPDIRKELTKHDDIKTSKIKEEKQKSDDVAKQHLDMLQKIATKETKPVAIKASAPITPTHSSNGRAENTGQRLVLDRISDKGLMYLSAEE